MWQYNGVQSMKWAWRTLTLEATVRRQSVDLRCRRWARVWKHLTCFFVSLIQYWQRVFLPMRIAGNLALELLHYATSSATFLVNSSTIPLLFLSFVIVAITSTFLLLIQFRTNCVQRRSPAAKRIFVQFTAQSLQICDKTIRLGFRPKLRLLQ